MVDASPFVRSDFICDILQVQVEQEGLARGDTIFGTPADWLRGGCFKEGVLRRHHGEYRPLLLNIFKCLIIAAGTQIVFTDVASTASLELISV